MKKILLGLSALVMVLSGVAMVSAYEAHLINVTAHVENALEVDTTPIDFGTVFPEEWSTEEFTVQMSASFCDDLQTRVTWIDYEVWMEWKPNEGMDFAWDDGGTWVAGADFYNWMGYFTYVGIEPLPGSPLAGDLTLVGGPPAGVPGTAAKWVMDAPAPLHKLSSPFNPSDLITVGIDVPDFEGFWNALTDVDPKPSGESVPTYVVPAAMSNFDPTGMDFGLDLKIQVVEIVRVVTVAVP